MLKKLVSGAMTVALAGSMFATTQGEVSASERPLYKCSITITKKNVDPIKEVAKGTGLCKEIYGGGYAPNTKEYTLDGSSFRLKTVKDGQVITETAVPLEYKGKYPIDVQITVHTDEKKKATTTNKTTNKTTTNKTTTATTKKVKYVTASALNVRQSATTKSKVITSVKKGTALTILAQKGKWHKVKVNGKTGWVSGDYLTTKKPATKQTTAKKTTTAKKQTTTVKKATKTKTVTAKVLNVRASATTNSKVVTTVKKGTKLTILDQKGKWHKVKVNGKTGWVSGNYLK